MAAYTPPLDDLRFHLGWTGYAEHLASLDRFEHVDLDTAMAMLEEIGRFGVEVLAPLDGPGDAAGIGFDPDTGVVTMPEGFREAYAGFVEQGFHALEHDEDLGGVGAPATLAVLAGELVTACNKSFSMCTALSAAVAHSLHLHGSEALQAAWLPALVSGEATGTMCLTEPAAGTDLGLVTTKATPRDDGSFRLDGTKQWITFGEHDLTDQTVHMVLARLPDAPEGTRGLSLFLVPKQLDGAPNGVRCIGVEHKLGIHASPTCMLSFEDATAWIVGAPNEGLARMFTMMNTARLEVGIEGLGLGEAARQVAHAFALDRRQGRALDPARREAGAAADPIVVHPDVRARLLDLRSLTEGLRGLLAWVAVQLDRSRHDPDEATRKRCGDLVSLLTPVIKSFGSEQGFLATSEALQIMGGAGYTRDFPVERHLRDVRVAMVYEGTNHVQALDLVGRQLPRKGGRAWMALLQQLGGTLQRAVAHGGLDDLTTPFTAALEDLNASVGHLMGWGQEDRESVAAVASDFLDQVGHVLVGWCWLEQVLAAHAAGDDALLARKTAAARWWLTVRMLRAKEKAGRVALGRTALPDVDGAW